MFIRLSCFATYPSDHDRIAACRRTFRSSARYVSPVKIRTALIRDTSSVPLGVLGFLELESSEERLREAVGALDLGIS
jgi:hypothetical protein